ncbi:hypothetical protein V3C99_017146 [Haemonchus contortus]|uniref:Uncharacterized protein n=1 Tax=Haemonchus contortus TaxID=6289 RepID=A0A7I4Z6V8_HAECO
MYGMMNCFSSFEKNSVEGGVPIGHWNDTSEGQLSTHLLVPGCQSS